MRSLIGVNFPRGEEMCYSGPQEVLDQPLLQSLSPETLQHRGYQTAAERLAHHLQNCWPVLLRAAVEEGAQTGSEVGVPF